MNAPDACTCCNYLATGAVALCPVHIQCFYAPHQAQCLCVHRAQYRPMHKAQCVFCIVPDAYMGCKRESGTFRYVLKSFGVALSVLMRIHTHTSSSLFQAHSTIFPEYDARSISSADSQETRSGIKKFQKILNHV